MLLLARNLPLNGYFGLSTKNFYFLILTFILPSAMAIAANEDNIIGCYDCSYSEKRSAALREAYRLGGGAINVVDFSNATVRGKVKGKIK